MTLDPGHPDAGAGFALSVDAAALVSGNRLRDHTMRTKHLEVETYPTIEFASTAIRWGATGPEAGGAAAPGGPAPPWRDGEERRAVVEGRLRLHGVDRPLSIRAILRYDNGLLTADGEAAFALSDFAIPIPRFLWLVLDDHVTVTLHAVGRERAGTSDHDDAGEGGALGR